MRKIGIVALIITLTMVFNSGPVVGQTAQYLNEEYRYFDELQPVHVTDIINTEEFISSAIDNTRLRNPDLYARALYKAGIQETEVSYEVGDEHTFFVLKFDGQTGARYSTGWFDEVTARLMAVGDVSQVWVSVDELENEHVTQNEIDTIMEALEERTPSASYDPDNGIFELVRRYFGSPPNIDQNGNKGAGNGRTDVLLTDIDDGWDPDERGGFVAGFFITLDQNTTQQFSNRRDIIYVDTYPGIYNPLQESRNPNRPLSTLAHEFQHLVFHNYRGTVGDETWLNEGLSEFSEAFCGFGLRSPAQYFSNTNRSMTRWGETTSEEVLRDYSRVALWTMYLWEQLGNDYIRRLVQLPTTYGRGIQIVNRAAQEVGSERRFPDLFQHFNIANYVNDKNVDRRYGYDYSFDGRPDPRQYHNDPNVSRQGIQMPAYASYFIEYTLGDSLEIRFNSSSNITIKAIEVGRDVVNVVPVSVGETYIQNDYGEVYRTIMFAVINSGASTVSFDYASEGGFRYFVDEYKFDDGTPRAFSGQAAYLGFPSSEEYIRSGWAVRFTPEFPENQLLQARIFAVFEQEFQGSDVPDDVSKSFYFHVWGDDNGNPGEDLIEPFIVETTRESFTQDFLDIDLYDYAGELRDIQGPVYIGFTHDNEYSVYVGMTNQLNQNRTFAFFGPHHPSNPNRWARMFDLTVGDDISLEGWNMMMRAVFAVYDPDRRIEPLPEKFVLEQNYPNPFNQETTIRYDLPIDSEVKIEIFDVLGRKVKTLVDDFKEAGTYPVIWNATDERGIIVSSGVYYYRMISGETVTTKKMILLR